MNAASRALFIFAHQDDEYGAAPWIVEELESGAEVACLYLTDGASRVAAEIRDGESRAALASLGVPGAAAVFLQGEAGRIADGGLAARSLEGLQLVRNWIERSAFFPTRVYTHSYEGGHPDHDAAHLIAAAVASERGLLDDAWHFSLYNAFRCRQPFFSTLRQLPSSAASRKPHLPRATLYRLALLSRFYRSQRRTWAGLMPGAFAERVLYARESVVRFDATRFYDRPHPGELLYERLFDTRYGDFAERVAPLRRLLRNAGSA